MLTRRAKACSSSGFEL